MHSTDSRFPVERARRGIVVSCWLVLGLGPATLHAAEPQVGAVPREHPRQADSAAADAPTWIFFRDKGLTAGELGPALERERAALSPRALARRERVRGDGGVDARDLPPAPAYVRAVLAGGARLRAVSRWLNAITVEAEPAQLAAIARLPFVASLQPVPRVRLDRRAAREARHDAVRQLLAPDFGEAAAYGVAQSQLKMLRVPALHACGLTGDGVVIGVQDTGFSLDHVAFAGAEVLAARDFVHDDDIVADEANDPPDQDAHGTKVLSLIIGNDGDKFSGVAPGAAVLLAKTEVTSEEMPYEEDFYVEGLEWLETMGADLFSGSLSYRDWYDDADFDGKTTVVAQAASVALANGLIMFTSMGNSGPQPGTLGTPADVDGIIAIGSTNLDGVIASSSSRGPTSDGRIKPDLVAPGAGVWAVLPGSLDGYDTFSGTSYSTPLAAGVGALLLQADPQLDPAGMLALLRSTAVAAGEPNNVTGWGMIDGLAAAGLHCPCVDEDADGHCARDDCDDTRADVNPDAPEVCDGLDNDCDAVVPSDEVDGDGDGVRLCQNDCDDSDPLRHPGAREIPDDCVDNDCDGEGDVVCESTGDGSTTGTTTGEPEPPTSGNTEDPTSTGSPTTGSSASTGAPATGSDGCDCSTRPPRSSAGWLLLAAFACARRRRRPVVR